MSALFAWKDEKCRILAKNRRKYDKMKRHRIHPVSKLRKKPFGEKELFTMADFSINYRLFIDPLGNEHGERKKIDGFLDLLSAFGVAGVLSPRDGKGR